MGPFSIRTRFEVATIDIDLSGKTLREMLDAIADAYGIRIGINEEYLKECQDRLRTLGGRGKGIDFVYKHEKGAEESKVLKTASAIRLSSLFSRIFSHNFMKAKILYRPESVYITPMPIDEYVRDRIRLRKSWAGEAYIEPEIEYDKDKKILAVTASKLSFETMNINEIRELDKPRLEGKELFFWAIEFLLSIRTLVLAQVVLMLI